MTPEEKNDPLRARTASELAKMFAKGKRSKYGSPTVDGLGLIDRECKTIAKALREHAKRCGR